MLIDTIPNPGVRLKQVNGLVYCWDVSRGRWLSIHRMEM